MILKNLPTCAMNKRSKAKLDASARARLERERGIWVTCTHWRETDSLIDAIAEIGLPILYCLLIIVDSGVHAGQMEIG